MSNSRKMIFGRYDYAAFSSLFSYASASIIVPVALVSLARELDFSLEEGGFAAGGALQVGRSLAIMVTMLLSGFIAGKFGKRKTYGVSVILLFLGMVLCSFAPTYFILFSALMVAGLGEGVIEALATPFVSDLHTKEPGRYVNFTHSFWSIGILFTVIVSGVLLTLGVSWRYLTLGVGGLALIPIFLLIYPESAGREFPEHPDKLSVKDIFGHIFDIIRKKRFWVFYAAMFFAGGGEFCLTYWCASYIQLNFNTAAWTGGVGTAFFAAGMILGRAGAGYFVKQQYLRMLVILSGVIGGIIAFFFPHIDNLWVFFLFLFLAGITVAPFWPSIQTYAVDRMHEQDSTMMYILLSCAGIPGCGFFTMLMGYIGNIYGSLDNAFYLVPFCFLFIAIIIGYDYLKNERK